MQIAVHGVSQSPDAPIKLRGYRNEHQRQNYYDPQSQEVGMENPTTVALSPFTTWMPTILLKGLLLPSWFISAYAI